MGKIRPVEVESSPDLGESDARDMLADGFLGLENNADEVAPAFESALRISNLGSVK